MAATIHDACRKGDLDAVRSLIFDNPELVDSDDQHDWRPIFHAALFRHVDVVRFLLDSGADISAHDGYVLHYAAEVPENKAIVQMLVINGALDAHVRPMSDLSRQLLAALFVGDETRVASLLKKHPELATAVDGRGDFPIHHACRNGDTGIVKLLIDSGADVNAVTDRGHTVLYCAGGHGHIDTVQLLLDHGSDVDTKFTKDGKNLLEWLAQFPEDKRLSDVARVLTEHKNRL